MNKMPIEFAKQWLQKVKNDIFTADTLLEKRENPPDLLLFIYNKLLKKNLKFTYKKVLILIEHTTVMKFADVIS